MVEDERIEHSASARFVRVVLEARSRRGGVLLADRAKARIEKKLFQQLACAEQGQFLMFQDMHEYYIAPVHWFSRREKLHWDRA